LCNIHLISLIHHRSDFSSATISISISHIV
jgi:hypothetical protein